MTGQIFGAEYFVNSNAPPGGNGSSWAQAWQSFSDFDINILSPGCTIKVAPGIYNTIQSGGNDETAVVWIKNNHDITIMKGDPTVYENPEFLEVIFYGYSPPTDEGPDYYIHYGIRIFTESSHHRVYNIKIINLTFQKFRKNAIQVSGYTNGFKVNNITIEGCKISESKGNTDRLKTSAGIMLRFAEDCTLKTNNIYQNVAYEYHTQTEGIYVAASDNILIQDNYIQLHHVIPYTPGIPPPHLDGIHATIGEGVPNNGLTVENNIIINTGYNLGLGVPMTRSGIHVLNTKGEIILRNNNIVVPYGKDLINIWLFDNTTSFKVFNNTLVCNGNPDHIMEVTKGDQTANLLQIKNNIFYKAGGDLDVIYFSGFYQSEITSSNLNYNLYHHLNGSATLRFSTSIISIDWDDIDDKGKGGNPEFAITGYKYSLQLTSPAKNAGIFLPEVTTDIEGIKRPYWPEGVDMGAFELPEAQFRIGITPNNYPGDDIVHTIEAIGTYWKKDGAIWPITTSSTLAQSSYTSPRITQINPDEWNGFHFDWLRTINNKPMGHALYKVSNNQDGSDYFYIDLRDVVTGYNPNFYVMYDATVSQKKYSISNDGVQFFPIINGSILRIWEIVENGLPQTYPLENFWSNALVWVPNKINDIVHPKLVWGPYQTDPPTSVTAYMVYHKVGSEFQELELLGQNVYDYTDLTREIGGSPNYVDYHVRAFNPSQSPTTNDVTVQLAWPSKQYSTQKIVSFNLEQNYPNPFNPSTTISFSLPKDEYVTLKIYDILGCEIKTLVNGDYKPGSYDVLFDAKDLASGIYIYRLTAGTFTAVKKLQILK